MNVCFADIEALRPAKAVSMSLVRTRNGNPTDRSSPLNHAQLPSRRTPAHLGNMPPLKASTSARVAVTLA